MVVRDRDPAWDDLDRDPSPVIVGGWTTVGAWSLAEQIDYERRRRPRFLGGDAVIVRHAIAVAPVGCWAVLQSPIRRQGVRPDTVACNAAVVPGRLFCRAHAALGWCPWRPPAPRPVPPPVPRPAPMVAPDPAPPAPPTVAPREAGVPPAGPAPWADFPPIPPRSWTRVTPWGEERYAEDACGEAWARWARVVCASNEQNAVTIGERNARTKPRVGDWRGDHTVAARARR